ncbi:crotonobetainyl-CoA:carnitine CoA-transferase [Hoeflea sp. BAL378]|nr:crotonobetainyl-CoA:carnitine CoA-transferase [Hoeflea sp. BAL378]
MAAEFPPGDRTLSTLLTRQAEKYRDKPLVTCGDARWSFEQTARIAQTYARYLAHAGVTAGDRVAIHSGNRAEFLQVYLGCAWLGAIATPINTAFRGAQLAHVMNNAEPKLLVVESGFLPVYDDLPEGTRVPGLIWRIEDDQIVTGQGDLAAVGAELGDVVPCTTPGQTVAILYTSGTTGPSKGVCCPQAQMFWWGVYSARALGVREGDVLMTTLPVFHTNALNTFYQALLNGCEYVLEPKFSASRFWDRARETGATVTYLLGAMAAILMAQPARGNDRDHSVRVALGGGVPGPMQAPFLERFGVPLVDGYASTETNFVFYTPAPSDHPGSMGYLAPGAEAMIVDEHQTPVPDGVAGELLLRPTEPYSFASGYFGMAEKTVEAWQNLWFHTGDRVQREPEGYYRFIDRTKDAIRRRGENVSSWEVEQVILSHPAIKACAAYPVPSELGEEEVAVALQLKPGVEFDELDLIKYAESRLAYFAVPRFLRRVDDMPLTENGKVKKVVLRSDGIVDGMWDRDQSGYKIRR